MTHVKDEPQALAGLRPFFEPRVVAVIGASRNRHKIGSEILHNLAATKFAGKIIPVHPSCSELLGLPAFPRLVDIPDDVDLAVVVVPSAQVEEVVDDCLEKGVRAICVISAGFGECSAEGRARERALAEKVRLAGARMVGPNCMGLLNTDPAVSLNATFSPIYPPAGQIAMSTQSGALGLAILDYARTLNIGLSNFVSIGNKADVSSNDLLLHWEHDPRTSVILLYLESFGNPARFSRIARRVSRHKPIVALKAGRSAAGARAAASHTGALATSDAFVDALFHQSGVVRTDTVTELFDVAMLLSRQPLPAGRRVAIVTNAGGPGIIAADACQSRGLTVAELTDATRAALRAFLPAAASVSNPVDMLASAPAAHYEQTLRLVSADPNVDSILVIFIPPLVTAADEVAQAIARCAAAQPDKPIAGVFMQSQSAPSALNAVPCFAFPEPAVIAMARVAQYAEWREQPSGAVPVLDGIRTAAARQIVERAAARGGGWLAPLEAQALIGAAGIATPAALMAGSIDEAVVAAERVGFPVAIKAVGAELLHKTEHKAVLLNLKDRHELRAAASALTTRLGSRVEGLLVQRMVDRGVEMMLGAINDPVFGPVIVCGTGGTMIELLADSACRLHPLTDVDAIGMVNSLKGARLLRGFRGGEPADEHAFVDSILRLSALIDLCPEIQELDVNPLLVLPNGVSAPDVRVRIRADAHPAATTTR